jgi:hypothetical protein
MFSFLALAKATPLPLLTRLKRRLVIKHPLHVK